MAILKEERTQQQIYLRPLHVFGRNLSKADTTLNNSDASQIHASIRWNGAQWEIIDHSRNGTLIDGKRLVGNTKQKLATGQRIQFATGSALVWQVENLDPPCAMLVPQFTGSGAPPVTLLKNIHFLPDDNIPEASIYRSPLGQWVFETTIGDKVLQDGDTVEVGEQVWRFVGSPEFEATTNIRQFGAPTENGVIFDFFVSQNEEHITLTISIDDKNTDLNSNGSGEKRVSLGERTHHYSLLTLARARFQDASQGFEVSSQGWLASEQLARMLGLEQSHLYTQLFRVRHQIAQEFGTGNNLENVIERRRGEVRFGAFGFRIKRGDNIEAEFTPT